MTFGIECEKCQAALSPAVAKVLVGSNCNECGRYRFASTQPSYLYFFTHPEERIHTIGIGTIGKGHGRIEMLLENGWIAYGIWHGDQRTTFLWEKKIFAELKKSIDTQEDWGTTWPQSISADSITAPKIAEIIARTVKSIGRS